MSQFNLPEYSTEIKKELADLYFEKGETLTKMVALTLDIHRANKKLNELIAVSESLSLKIEALKKKYHIE